MEGLKDLTRASVVIAEEGSFTSDEELALDTVIYRRGAPQPYIINGNLLIAERDSVKAYPDSLNLVSVNRGCPWPSFVAALV